MIVGVFAEHEAWSRCFLFGLVIRRQVLWTSYGVVLRVSEDEYCCLWLLVCHFGAEL